MDLREQQKALARQRILDALVDVIGERRHLDFSVQEVADRAGVSLRTVYNHFSSREELLDALAGHFDEMTLREGGVLITEVDDIDTLLKAMARNFRVFDRLDGRLDAWIQMSATPRWLQQREGRTHRMFEIVGDAVPGVPAQDRAIVAAVVRHLVSFRSWHSLTRDYGLTTEEAIAATRWTVITTLAQVNSGRLPSSEIDVPVGGKERVERE